jgi:hypothetical protein
MTEPGSWSFAQGKNLLLMELLCYRLQKALPQVSVQMWWLRTSLQWLALLMLELP